MKLSTSRSNYSFAFLAVSACLLTSSPGWSQTGTGLKGDYYPNTSLTGTVALTRTDPTINFTWTTTGPAPSIPADRFSVRWTGQVEAPVTGIYTFVTRSDDGVRLWINGKLLINNWRDHGAAYDQSIPVSLTGGQKYSIQLEYYENNGGAVMQLFWKYPNQAEQIVPQQRLYLAPITLQPAPTVTSRSMISDLNWLSETNGWGPVERDRSNGEQGARDGKAITIGGRRYSDGLGVHAASEIRIALNDRYDMFRSIIGVDDEVGDKGSVIFEIWLDGRRAYQSPTMKGNMAGLAIEVPVENALEMRLVVTNAGDGIDSDHADWADARLEGIEQIKYLSDLNWVTATNGRGPVEKDRANGGTGTGDGEKIKLDGQTYRKGLGTYANAEIKFSLDRKYDLFSSVLGIDDSANGAGSAVFEIWADNVRIYQSPIVRSNTPMQHPSVSVRDKQTLVLKVLDAGDGSTGDLADWADAQLLPIGSDGPAAPTSLKAVAGNGQVTLTWVSSQGASGYNVYRGTTSGGEAVMPVATNVTGTTYVNTGLTNDTKYYFRLRAVSSSGMGPNSSEVSAKPEPPPLPPPTSAPTNVSATPGNARITLSWNAVSSATAYRIFRATTAGGQTTTALTTVATTTHDDTGLTNGTPYFYKIAAINSGGAGPLSLEATGTPKSLPEIPSNLTATPGNAQVTLAWNTVPGATSYKVFRALTSGGQTSTALTTVTTNSFLDTGLTNGTPYFYKVAAVNASGTGGMSNQATTTPLAVPAAPTTLSAAPGNAQIKLTWIAPAGATSYRVFRATTSNGQTTTPLTTVTTATFTDTTVTNLTTYFYKVAAVNAAGQSPMSNEANAIPQAAPVAPTGISATAGDKQITVSWTAVPTATGYNVYRASTSNSTAVSVATNLAAPTFLNTGLTNGTTYSYKVTAVNGSGESPRSIEAIGTPSAPAPGLDPALLSAWRLLRQATWGPKPGDADRVKLIGANAFLSEQLSAPASVYPDTLFDQSIDFTQEQLMTLALTGQDQLRQRLAWALHKIWVVSAVEVSDSAAIVTYKRILLNGTFGNYRTLMRNVALNPAMGRYLNMLNNKSKTITGVDPNENFARELMQLFTLGIPKLNTNGSPAGGNVYTEEDVKELARVFTGWTFGDGNPATIPTNLAPTNWKVPMEAVENFHDKGAKTFLGVNIPPGNTSSQDLDEALDIIFNNPNIGPFVCKNLIQQLVTSNPSATYINDVATIFNGTGSNARGDMSAVIRAILTHTEAGTGAGKLMEPVLYVISQMRSLNATVVDHPFMTDLAEEMGQKAFFPPSVFSYFSPGYRIRATTLGGPEFQILTSVTSLVRTNFVARLLSGGFGTDVTIDYTPFTSKAVDPAVLVDYCNLLFMGGQMSAAQRAEIISAVGATSNTTDRVQTAIYLTLTAAQFQVDR